LNYLNKNLVTDYMAYKLTFYKILQFLFFTRTRHFKKEMLNGELYYTFSFLLVDFARQIELHLLNRYQRKRLSKFFYKLQELPLICQ